MFVVFFEPDGVQVVLFFDLCALSGSCSRLSILAYCAWALCMRCVGSMFVVFVPELAHKSCREGWVSSSGEGTWPKSALLSFPMSLSGCSGEGKALWASLLTGCTRSCAGRRGNTGLCSFLAWNGIDHRKRNRKESLIFIDEWKNVFCVYLFEWCPAFRIISSHLS